MPLYLYRCQKCEGRIELMQGLGEAAPVCCSVTMERLPTSPALITVMKDKNHTPLRSEGYKKGYSEEYLKSIGKS